ncbi:LysR substrate-binding domain-containing protein [Thalassospira sp.]|uniref:LysR substrate-binding domain-containing protein n=1 Tax=Thalassospira sp. TaxID=1912094 RepID=UPI003AA80D78
MCDVPPLKALHAFDAAMRLNSFSLAAEEMNVTPGAVGQQIRKLEDWLGVALFTRHVRRVEATADGLAYAARIRPALDQITEASRSLRHQHAHSVRVVMPPSFAAKWFSRRMSRFLIAHPGTELHVGSSSEVADFGRDPVDIAIRYFSGEADHLQSILLHRGQAALFCAPEYRERIGLNQPADLMRATLLNDTLHAWWPEWLGEFAGLDKNRIKAIRKIDVDLTSVAIESAIHGQGVLMAVPLLAEEDVLQGKLVPLFPQCVLAVPFGYYLVHPKNAELRGQVKLFRDWILNEAQDISI